jgi:hypothetical protein
MLGKKRQGGDGYARKIGTTRTQVDWMAGGGERKINNLLGPIYKEKEEVNGPPQPGWTTV